MEFVAARLDSGRGARVLVRRDSPLRPRETVVARDHGTSLGLYRVGQLRDGLVELLPVRDGGTSPGERWLTDGTAVVGTLLLRWQCGEASSPPFSDFEPSSR